MKEIKGESVSYPLLILREERDDLSGELFRLKRVDAEKSAKRIEELEYLIPDLEYAINLLYQLGKQ